MPSCQKNHFALCWAVLVLWTAMLTVSARASTNAPALEFLSIPSFGSNSNLLGRVLNVNPADLRVAVYIYVGGWYNKPSFGSPSTDIQTNGNWPCDITTAGNDSMATRIAAFLMPTTNSPPLVNGANVLPATLDQLSVAQCFVNRYANEIDFSFFWVGPW